MKILSSTDIGVKRGENQDNYWSALLNIDGSEAGIICLCDGMGGLKNGGLASKIVVESIRDGIKDGLMFRELEDILIQSSKNIYDIAQSMQCMMGTTCTLLQCHNGKYEILHVGDTRCYLLRGNNFNPLTTDHSALQQYHITREANEVLWRRYRNSLTRCIGVKPTVVVDYYSGYYQEDDVFFVCSDGLWHYFNNNSITKDELFNLKGLIKKCIKEGELDNITASLLSV